MIRQINKVIMRVIVTCGPEAMNKPNPIYEERNIRHFEMKYGWSDVTMLEKEVIIDLCNHPENCNLPLVAKM